MQGHISDPLMGNVISAINNEDYEELQDILDDNKGSVDRLKRTELSGGTLLHYACSR